MHPRALLLAILLAGCAAPLPPGPAPDACRDAMRSGGAEGGERGARALGEGPSPPSIEKPLVLLTVEEEWLDLCGRSFDRAPLGAFDPAREDVLVAHGHCVHGLRTFAAANVTEVYATRCPDRFHAVAVPKALGELRLVDLAGRFAPPHEPPTQDPPEPYDFDPAAAVHLTRDPDGVLRRVDGGSTYTDGEWRSQPAPPQEPLPPCEAPREPGGAHDGDGDKVYDDLEALLSTLAHGQRASAIVAMRCPLAWNDVLAMRETVGHFPVNALWSTGAMAFAADLTPEQVRGLARLEGVRAVEGNGVVSLS